MERYLQSVDITQDLGPAAPTDQNNVKSENSTYLVGFCDTLAVGDPGYATYDPSQPPAE